MIEDRYWKCSDDLLKQIGLDKNYFMTHTPSE
jgi:hypothetical protein